MEVNISGSKIEIIQGDITEQDTQAVVNAANTHLWMGSGVAGAMKKKGGSDIETDAIEQGPVNIGESVLTTGGDLKAQWIIHAASMGQDQKTNVDYVSKATISALELAEEKSIQSLSFPAIGTGAGGVQVNQCASAMLNQTIEFLQKSKNVSLVRFVLFDETTLEAFNNELKHFFARH